MSHPPETSLSSRELAERFWHKVNKDGPIPEARPDLGPCWLWLGAKTRGYGRFSVAHRKNIPAHRFSYESVHGPIPDGLEPDHLCRNRSCVNDGHLEPVTTKVNVLRGVGVTAANKRKIHCKNGHLLAGANLSTSRCHIRRGWRRCVLCMQMNKVKHREETNRRNRTEAHRLKVRTREAMKLMQERLDGHMEHCTFPDCPRRMELESALATARKQLEEQASSPRNPQPPWNNRNIP